MGLSGAAYGASQSLDEILAKKLIEAEQQRNAALQQQRLEQDAAQTAAQQDIQRAQLDRLVKGDAAEEAYRAGQVERQGRLDQQGENMRGLELMAAEVDLQPKPPARKVITTIGKRGEPISKAVTEDELVQGVPEYRAPTQGGQPRAQQWVIRNGQIVPIAQGTAQLGDQPYDAVAARQQGSSSGDLTSLYSAVRGSRAIETIDELLNETSAATAGPLGSVQRKVMPGTPGFDYGAKLESLGSQIAQQELAQMREASKTGGAVGQVSNFEQQMFMNALAPIQQGQSPSAMRAGLTKAKASLERYRTAIQMKAEGRDDQEILAALYGTNVPFALSGAGGRGRGAGGRGRGAGGGPGPAAGAGGGFKILSVEP